KEIRRRIQAAAADIPSMPPLLHWTQTAPPRSTERMRAWRTSLWRCRYVGFGDSWYKNRNEITKESRRTLEAKSQKGETSMNLKIAAFIAIAAVCFAAQGQAHHSFAMFDHEKMITVSGTLIEFEWTNPHCWLHVGVADAATGRTLDWAFEMGSI